MKAKKLSKAEKEAMKLLFKLPDEAEAERLADSFRGRYDASRIERDHPQLVKLITTLLAVPFMSYQSIAQSAGVAWETVAAIAACRKTSIREIRVKAAGQIMLVIEAALPGLMEQAVKGLIPPLGLKLLVDAYQQLTGEGHQVTFQGKQEEDPRRTRLRQLISDSPHRMVFEAEVIPQKAALLDGAILPPPVVQENTSNAKPD